MAPNLTPTPLHWLPPLLAGDGRPCWQPLKREGSWSSSVSVRRVLWRASWTDSLAVPVSNVRRPFCLAAHGQYEKAIGQRAAGKARGEGGGFMYVVLGWASWLMLKMIYTELAWEISWSCGFDPVFLKTPLISREHTSWENIYLWMYDQYIRDQPQTLVVTTKMEFFIPCRSRLWLAH